MIDIMSIYFKRKTYFNHSKTESNCRQNSQYRTVNATKPKTNLQDWAELERGNIFRTQ